MYLGVLLDNSLDWKDQVRAVSLKVSRGLGILNRHRGAGGAGGAIAPPLFCQSVKN